MNQFRIVINKSHLAYQALPAGDKNLLDRLPSLSRDDIRLVSALTLLSLSIAGASYVLEKVENSAYDEGYYAGGGAFAK